MEDQHGASMHPTLETIAQSKPLGTVLVVTIYTKGKKNAESLQKKKRKNKKIPAAAFACIP